MAQSNPIISIGIVRLLQRDLRADPVWVAALSLLIVFGGAPRAATSGPEHMPASLQDQDSCNGVCSVPIAQELSKVARRPEDYRRFALSNQGDVARGKSLFNDAAIGCVRCHSVDGAGSAAGPDLQAIGDKYPRLGLIQSVLEPSASILPGYNTTVVMTKSGIVHDGILRQVSDSEIELLGPDGRSIRVGVDEIEQRTTSDISSMSQGLEQAMTLADFGSLISYLETLKQPALKNLANARAPEVIEPLERPIALRPFHSLDLRFEHPVWFGSLPGIEHLFVVLEHQQGRIWLLQKRLSGDRKTLFADFGDEVSNGPFEGLMCIAFHPDFRVNRRYYLKHEVVERSALDSSRRETGGCRLQN